METQGLVGGPIDGAEKEVDGDDNTGLETQRPPARPIDDAVDAMLLLVQCPSDTDGNVRGTKPQQSRPLETGQGPTSHCFPSGTSGGKILLRAATANKSHLEAGITRRRGKTQRVRELTKERWFRLLGTTATNGLRPEPAIKGKRFAGDILRVHIFHDSANG